MKRVAINILTIASLIIAVTATVEAFRSHWRKDSVGYISAVGKTGVSSVSLVMYYGRVTFGFWHARFAPEGRERYVQEDNEGKSNWQLDTESSVQEPLNEPTRRSMKWFGFSRTEDPPTADARDPLYKTTKVTVPLPLIVVLSFILPMVKSVRIIHRRARRKAGCCPSCGYDLRATPNRCPECGFVCNSDHSAAA